MIHIEGWRAVIVTAVVTLLRGYSCGSLLARFLGFSSTVSFPSWLPFSANSRVIPDGAICRSWSIWWRGTSFVYMPLDEMRAGFGVVIRAAVALLLRGFVTEAGKLLGRDVRWGWVLSCWAYKLLLDEAIIKLKLAMRKRWEDEEEESLPLRLGWGRWKDINNVSHLTAFPWIKVLFPLSKGDKIGPPGRLCFRPSVCGKYLHN